MIRSLIGLLYFGLPFYFGWQGTGVFVPVLCWLFLAVLSFLSEWPDPKSGRPMTAKSQAITTGITLVVWVSIYYVGRLAFVELGH
jgi:hypothetical protein